MPFRYIVCVCSLMAVVAQTPVTWAQSEPEGELQAVQEGLKLSAERQAKLAAEAKALAAEQDALSNRLVELADTAAVQERELATIEKRQDRLKREMAAINLKLAAKQDVMAEILAGLQRLEQNPPPALVVSPDDVLEALRGAMIFGAIVPELQQAARELHDTLADLTSLRTKFAAEAESHAKALHALAASRDEIHALIASKKALALTSAQELDNERKRAEALAEKATSLRQLLEDLAIEKAKAEAKRTADEKARAEAARRLEEQRSQPLIAFSKSRGQLNYPAAGQIIKPFGADNGLGNRLDGIVIATAKQAQVRSPMTGKVEFAGRFRSYGQMVIINAGEGYLMLLAGLEQTLASHGQAVKAGEPVGQMGDKPGRLAVSNGLTNLTTPVLYVELRQNGDVVDSTPWWIGQKQEAMR